MEGAVGMELMRNSKEGSAMHRYYYSAMDGNPKAFVKTDLEGLERVLRRARASSTRASCPRWA